MGFGSGSHLSAEMDAWGDGDWNKYSVKSSRIAEFGYAWRWSERNLLTLAVAQESLTHTQMSLHSWAPSPTVNYEEEIHAYQLGWRHLYGQLEEGAPRLFSGIALGQIETKDAFSGMVTRSTGISEIDIFGVQSEGRFYWFVAFGLGDSGLARAGIGAGF